MARTVRDPSARERIIEAARRAVASRGISGASMRVIAAEAGVTTGFVTHYFAGKQEVMEAMLDATNAAAARRVARVIATDKPALERVHRAAEEMLPIDPERREEWRVWAAVWSDASVGDTLANHYRDGWLGLRRMLAGLLAEAQEEEQLHDEVDVEYRADRLVTLLAGIGLLAGVEQPERARQLATQMLAEELAWLGDTPPVTAPDS